MADQVYKSKDDAKCGVDSAPLRNVHPSGMNYPKSLRGECTACKRTVFFDVEPKEEQK